MISGVVGMAMWLDLLATNCHPGSNSHNTSLMDRKYHSAKIPCMDYSMNPSLEIGEPLQIKETPLCQLIQSFRTVPALGSPPGTGTFIGVAVERYRLKVWGPPNTSNACRISCEIKVQSLEGFPTRIRISRMIVLSLNIILESFVSPAFFIIRMIGLDASQCLKTYRISSRTKV